MNRCFTVIVAVFGLLIWDLPIASAQQVSSFEQLQILVKPGDKIVVIGTDGKSTKGKIESLTPSALRLATKSGSRDYSQKDAFEIKQKRDDSLANGAWIGALTGGGVVGAGFIAVCSIDGCDGDAGLIAGSIAIYTGIGAAIGVGIDALIKHDQTIYRQPAQAALRSMRLEPLISSGRKGAVLRFSF